jgi:hypothetical protein
MSEEDENKDQNLDGKPVSQQFSDELDDMISRYHDCGLENSQVIGVLTMKKFDLMSEMREHVIRQERPY